MWLDALGLILVTVGVLGSIGSGFGVLVSAVDNSVAGGTWFARVACSFLLFCAGLYMLKKETNKRSIGIEERKRKEAEKKLKEATEKRDKEFAVSIFKKCREKKISSFNSEETQKALKIIAGTYGIEDISEAKQYYNQGKSLVESEELEQHKKELAKIRNEEKEKYEEAKTKATIKGKMKYTGELRNILIEEKKRLELLSKAQPVLTRNLAYQPQRQDWAVQSGIANAIGGGAAGLATAMDIQNQNAREEVRANQIREQARKGLDSAYEARRYLIHSTVVNERLLDSFKDKLYDETDIHGKFNMLKFSKWQFRVLESKNIEITGKVEVTEQIEMLGSKAILDGSVKIDILNSSNEIIGCGYYSAPGFGETDLSRAGFSASNNVKAICLIDNYTTISKDDTFTCKVSPVNMWFIES